MLFTRSPTGLVATDTATATLPYVDAMAGAVEGLVRSVSGAHAGEKGTVRVTCSELVGTFVLPSILVELRRAHPGLQLELSLTNSNEDLLRRDADIAVRMAPPTQAALVAKRAGVIKLGMFASKVYLAEHDLPRSTADLVRGHALIGRDRDSHRQ